MSLDETITLTRTTSTATTSDSPVAAAAAEELSVPREMGSVRLLRQIGQGAMGVVWLGHDAMLDRRVAVKFLLNAVSSPDDPGFARFLQGARAAAAVRHPALTALHHADLVHNVPYLVM